MIKRSSRWLVLAWLLLTPSAPASAQPPATATWAAAPDMIGRIFSGEFSPRFPRPPRWFGDGESYLVMEPSARGVDVVRYDTATGARRDVLITAAQLTPAGASAPLEIESLSWSTDRRRVLIFTNAHRVWRTDSRGDYWLLDRESGRLRKLGGAAPDASLMYATFNPDATKV